MSVSCEWCVLSDRGLCDGPITRPEEPYRVVSLCMWCRNLKNEAALAGIGLLRQRVRSIYIFFSFVEILFVYLPGGVCVVSFPSHVENVGVVLLIVRVYVCLSRLYRMFPKYLWMMLRCKWSCANIWRTLILATGFRMIKRRKLITR
jgi:hypothetical protein